MKSLMKKITAGVIAAVAAFGMAGLGASTAAAADPTATLTVTSTDAEFNGKTVNAYKMFKAEPDTSGANATYTLVDTWYGFFQSADVLNTADTGDTLSQSAYDYVLALKGDDAQLAAFAKKASDWAKDTSHNITPAVDPAPTAANGTATFSNIALGYYVVSPEGGSTAKDRGTDAILVNVTADATINMKSVYPTVKKEIVKDDQTTSQGNSAQVGSSVNFKLTSAVPDTSEYTTYTFKFVDVLSDGLKFTKNSVKVTVGGTELDTTKYTVTEGTVADGADKGKATVTIDLSGSIKDLTAGDEIVATYSATITKDAVVGNAGNNAAGNTNSVKVVYSNNPGTNSTGESIPSTTHSYTFNFNLKKFYKDNGTDTALAGAKFKLLKDGNAVTLVKGTGDTYRPKTADDAADVTTYTEVETPASGIIEFTGLEEGTYQLEETFAPKGFNKLTAPVDVEIEAEYGDGGVLTSWTVNGTAPTTDATIPVVSIENKQGALLPNTGGMGTALFTVFGVLIVALGAGWYVRSRRRA